LPKVEVAKILHLEKIVDQILDGFDDVKLITKTPLNEAQNLPAQVFVPKITTIPTPQSFSKPTHGPDKQPCKHKTIFDAATSPCFVTWALCFFFFFTIAVLSDHYYTKSLKKSVESK